MLICRDEQKAFWRNLFKTKVMAKIMKKFVEPNDKMAKINKKPVVVVRYDNG